MFSLLIIPLFPRLLVAISRLAIYIDTNLFHSQVHYTRDALTWAREKVDESWKIYAGYDNIPFIHGRRFPWGIDNIFSNNLKQFYPSHFIVLKNLIHLLIYPALIFITFSQLLKKQLNFNLGILKIFMLIMILFTAVSCSTNKLKDPKDKHKYKTVTINETVWMAENFCFADSSSYIVKNNKVIRSEKDNNFSNKYGRLYTFESAKKNAPPGWRLPTVEDLDALFYYITYLKLDWVRPESNFITVPNEKQWEVMLPYYESFKSKGTYGSSYRTRHRSGNTYFDVAQHIRSRTGWEKWKEISNTDDFGLNFKPTGIHIRNGYANEDGTLSDRYKEPGDMMQIWLDNGKVMESDYSEKRIRVWNNRFSNLSYVRYVKTINSH